jgi:hypothetical protein
MALQFILKIRDYALDTRKSTAQGFFATDAWDALDKDLKTNPIYPMNLWLNGFACFC